MHHTIALSRWLFALAVLAGCHAHQAPTPADGHHAVVAPPAPARPPQQALGPATVVKHEPGGADEFVGDPDVSVRQPPPPPPPPTTPPPPPADPKPEEVHGSLGGKGETRAGARRLAAAWSEGQYVSYQAQALRLTRLEAALRGRRLAAEVQPFAARAATKPVGTELPASGKLLGHALATQLQQLGWEVSAPDLEPGAPAARPGKGQRAGLVRITGAGSFSVAPGATATAQIEAQVRLTLDGRSVLDEVVLATAKSGEGVASARARAAASAALQGFVRKVLARAEPLLVAAVKP